MQLTKYRTKGNNVVEQLHNANIISKQLKLINSDSTLKDYGEPIPYMKNVLFNSNLCIYMGSIQIKNDNGSVHTLPFLNTNEFKLCLGLTDRPKLKQFKPTYIIIPDYIVNLL